MKYDYLVVGAGLFGAVFAHEAKQRGRSVLVLEKRPHVGGNCHTERQRDILIHRYGAHIFHTDEEEVWNYVRSFGSFVPYIHRPKANFNGKLFSLPFSMNTFFEMWGVTTEEEARAVIEKEKGERQEPPRNLEEQAIFMVGRTLYETLVKGYTEKQWGRPCDSLPPEIIRRIPLRFTYDSNYFFDRFQGIPEEGYTGLIENLLDGIEVRLGLDYLKKKKDYDEMAEHVVYTGPIDAYFGYSLGALSYRTLRFEEEWLDVPDFQELPVVNYTDSKTPFTRIIEHKHFEAGSKAESLPYTVITKEYSEAWQKGAEPYYPVADAQNSALYAAYRALARREKNVFFGGRLGEYRYYDMDDTVLSALKLAHTLL